jgi:hypothetical protein
VGIGGHRHVDWVGCSIVVVPIRDIDKRLKVSKELLVSAFREPSKRLNSLNLRRKVNMHYPFAACGFNEFPERHQPVIGVP